MSLPENMNEKSEYGRPPSSPQQHPWLVICHGKAKQKQTFFSISEDRYEVKTIPELRYTTILGRLHEWLVLLDCDSKDCYIWNPISMDKIKLPPLPEDTEYDNLECLLSAPPHDPECRLFFIKRLTVYFCRPGHDQEFYKQDLELDGVDGFKCWTVFKGKLYGLTLQETILVTLDLDHDSGIVQVTPLTDEPLDEDDENFLDMPCREWYLIQSCDDHLLYVRCLRFGLRFKEVYSFLIYRFDFVEKSWVRVNSIGESAIFLDSCGGINCSTRGTNLKRESIYFTEDGGRRLYVFNLETHSKSVSLPCLHVSKKYSWFYWLMLSPQCN